MSLKGQTCIYCNLEPSTKNGDHLLARSFIPIPLRNGVPKLPCCEPCNREKAALELYLTAVMPLGSRAENLPDYFSAVAHKLEGNLRLKREIFGGMEVALDPTSGADEKTLFFPFQSAKLTRYVKFLAIGAIYWATGNRIIPLHHIDVKFATHDNDLRYIWEFFHQTSGLKFQGQIGGDVLKIEGLANAHELTLCVVRFDFMNGFVVSDIKKRLHARSLWAFVANEPFEQAAN